MGEDSKPNAKTVRDALCTVANAYLDALLWTAQREDDDPRTVLGADQVLESVDDCAGFISEADEILRAHGYENGLLDLGHAELSRLGHDFLLTRDGHGAGFWDGSDWPNALGNTLAASCRPYGGSVADQVSDYGN